MLVGIRVNRTVFPFLIFDILIISFFTLFMCYVDVT